MKTRLAPFLLLALVGLLQSSVLVSIVWKQERLLSLGLEYRFRLAGRPQGEQLVRDRRMRLSFEVEGRSYDLPSPVDSEGEKELFALVSVGDDGFARIEALRYASEPGSCLRVERVKNSLEHAQVRIRLPFRNYYVGEEEARRLSLDGEARTRTGGLYATIRLRDGEGTLTGVYGDDGPLR